MNALYQLCGRESCWPNGKTLGFRSMGLEFETNPGHLYFHLTSCFKLAGVQKKGTKRVSDHFIFQRLVCARPWSSIVLVLIVLIVEYFQLYLVSKCLINQVPFLVLTICLYLVSKYLNYQVHFQVLSCTFQNQNNLYCYIILCGKLPLFKFCMLYGIIKQQLASVTCADQQSREAIKALPSVLKHRHLFCIA